MFKAFTALFGILNVLATWFMSVLGSLGIQLTAWTIQQTSRILAAYAYAAILIAAILALDALVITGISYLIAQILPTLGMPVQVQRILGFMMPPHMTLYLTLLSGYYSTLAARSIFLSEWRYLAMNMSVKA
jgi:hypothetical protein